MSRAAQRCLRPIAGAALSSAQPPPPPLLALRGPKRRSPAREPETGSGRWVRICPESRRTCAWRAKRSAFRSRTRNTGTGVPRSGDRTGSVENRGNRSGSGRGCGSGRSCTLLLRKRPTEAAKDFCFPSCTRAFGFSSESVRRILTARRNGRTPLLPGKGNHHLASGSSSSQGTSVTGAISSKASKSMILLSV